MYIIVVGGGKVGYYLAKELVNQGHELLVIEKDKRKSEAIAEDLGSVVLRGDGCEASTMAEAGTNRADVVVAVTGDDEDNLVICQMAKAKFNVPRTIARINNPKNERIFKLLGIDATVSSTDVILSHIEEEIPEYTLIHVLKLKQAGIELVEAKVAPTSQAAGKALKTLALPKDSVVSLIVRDSGVLLPTGDTVLAAGDQIVALTKVESEATLRRLFLE
ncbi:MAG: TrkA family potassium uptake protein [Chloroflexi bacterium]|nr:TrkA family potassium uptake protein [Chloroflexota bacterium]